MEGPVVQSDLTSNIILIFLPPGFANFTLCIINYQRVLCKIKWSQRMPAFTFVCYIWLMKHAKKCVCFKEKITHLSCNRNFTIP